MVTKGTAPSTTLPHQNEVDRGNSLGHIVIHGTGGTAAVTTISGIHNITMHKTQSSSQLDSLNSNSGGKYETNGEYPPSLQFRAHLVRSKSNLSTLELMQNVPFAPTTAFQAFKSLYSANCSYFPLKPTLNKGYPYSTISLLVWGKQPP